jgi:hypothetical protein
MAITDEQLEFIKTYAHCGAKSIAEATGLKYSTVVNVAYRHRISLKPKHDRRGRSLKGKIKYVKRIRYGDKCYLPIDHPVIMGMMKERGIVGKRELHTRQWKRQRELVLVRDFYECVYCHEPATEVDHIIPRAKGGGHELENLVACCKRCNGRKGSRSQAAFLGASFTPPVFIDNLSPMKSEVLQDSPFTARPVTDDGQ